MVTTDAGAGLREMSRLECLRRLRIAYVGRLGFVSDGRVLILPVNYRLEDGDEALLVRTGTGAKLEAARAGGWFSLQIGEEDHLDHAGWSVLVSGPVTVQEPHGLRGGVTELPLRPWAPEARAGLAVLRIPLAIVEGRRLR